MSDRSAPDRRINDILGFIEKIETILEDKTESDFNKDEILFLAIERLIQNIGEASIHLPLEIKNKAPHIPWKNMAGMRNILVHGYDIADESITWKTAKEDIYPLKEFLLSLNTGKEI